MHVAAVIYLLVRVNEPAQAEGLTAEVFLRVVDSLPNYVERGAPFGAWLFRIARGKLIDHYRRSARRPVADLTDTLPADDPDPGVSAETNESWRELQIGQRRQGPATSCAQCAEPTHNATRSSWRRRPDRFCLTCGKTSDRQNLSGLF